MIVSLAQLPILISLKFRLDKDIHVPESVAEMVTDLCKYKYREMTPTVTDHASVYFTCTCILLYI